MVLLSQSLLASLATTASLPFSAADAQFQSRPDLAPPKLNITVQAPDANGTEYVFISPYQGSLERPGAYIYRKNGDLVWAGTGYYTGFVGNFHPTEYHGEPVLQAFQGAMNTVPGTGYGQHVLLDQNYEHVVTATPGNHRIASLHEFNVIDGQTALVEIYQTTPADLTPYGGNSSQRWIGDGIFQEFDIATGDLVFEWSALDHIDPADSLVTLGSSESNSGLTSATSWDYAHLNSVDKDADGNYLLSARHTSTIYKVNGTDGSIIWKLGGNSSTFKQVGNWKFGYQHHARWLSHKQGSAIERFSLFDNSAGGVVHYNNVSSAVIIQLNHTDNTATIERKASAPYGLSARSQGNAQLLPNDHFFVGWGSAGAFTEFGPSDEVLYHAFIEDGVSYRAFARNWTGTPREDPAIVAFKTSSSVRLYVSWNGDTETSLWKFYRVGGGDKIEIGEVDRESFESSFVWKTSSNSTASSTTFFAEAFDKNGEPLARTTEVKAAPSL
ncbi:hypothetical protein P170DRAFT_474908 [Aspergillus steynii IBT 23096]|uniref:Arylsulfotransferase n=1 Tax=Aspergillus steynii IBT 23096 TaxID=1392250 RepID=A0A2I2GEP8_9EURO|nr:uncharacterized protein P170DRAFT_474908 [Aspergillus steynii IBT 23096]PLB51366.1 hypothetical protein P170DRAFT_474908 [Aspergillus steynii IBT 23096]